MRPPPRRHGPARLAGPRGSGTRPPRRRTTFEEHCLQGPYRCIKRLSKAGRSKTASNDDSRHDRPWAVVANRLTWAACFETCRYWPDVSMKAPRPYVNTTVLFVAGLI